MRSDRDKRTDKEREIDDFLAQFETPVDELSADISSYLETSDTTKMTAARTFYGEAFKDAAAAADSSAEAPSPEESVPAVSDASEKSAEEAAPSEEPAASAESEPAEEPETVAESEPEEKPESDTESEPEEKPESDTESEPEEKSEPDAVMAAEAEIKSAGAKVSGGAAKVADKVRRIGRKDLKRELFFKKNPKFDPSRKVSPSNKPYVFSIFKLFRDFVLIGVAMVLCFMIYALGCITLAPHIDPKDIYASVDTSSMIFDDAGKEIDSVYYTQNRQVVKYEEMPADLINSFVAIEDKTFWKHHGFNWTRMFGAILSSFGGGGRISGTSTITQQLARNVYLSDIKSVRSIRRKIVEMYYASKIERALSKEEIVEAYLNSIYLGYGCYGVDAAARTYFSKEVKDLSLVECAALAALPQAPEDYALLKYVGDGYQPGEDAMIVQKDPDTIVTNDTARARRDLTLRLMKDQGYIDETQFNEAADQSLNNFINPTITSGNGNYSYFHEYIVDTVISDLMDQYGMEYADAERMVYTKGLKIYSTMDSTAQNVIAEEFKDSSNFPTVSAIYNTDEDGNMLNNDGDIALYNYEHFFDEDGHFTLTPDDVKINSDGSVTILKGHDLHIYETKVDDGVDYSLEFKNFYVVDEDEQLYSIQGGYINVPSIYKSLDSDGNLIISADYFKDYAGDMVIEDDSLIITPDAYSLATRTMQPQAAMTIVGVGTGEVKAMVGGRSFRGQKLLNRSLNARQPGSSIKPLSVYGCALQKSYELEEKGQKWKYIDYDIDQQGVKGWGDYVTVHSSIYDERTHIEGKDWPENVTRSFSGSNTFTTAIQQSINTCAVKLLLQIGPDYAIQQLKKFGITTVVDDASEYANDINPAALALGAMCQGVEPLEMALAYAAFPGKGKLNTPICYTKVVDRKGETILEGKSTQTEAINEGVAFIMTDVLQSVVRANNYGISEVSHGGKTGTTNDKYDIWFDGFTPTYAASLWIGTDQNVEMSDRSYVAARLWGKIMNQIPKACRGEYPDQPSNVIEKYGEYFTKGTETGLTRYKSPEELRKEQEEKEREEQEKLRELQAKWDRERASHRKLIPEQGHYETKTTIIPHDAVYENQQVGTEDDPSRPIYGDPPIIGYEKDADGNDDPTKPIYGDPPIIGYEQRPVYKKVLVKEAWNEEKTEKVWVVDKPAHYEYEPGWRDGDRPTSL